MAKDQNQRNRERIERNRKAGLMKVTAWIPECRRDEFLQLAAAFSKLPIRQLMEFLRLITR